MKKILLSLLLLIVTLSSYSQTYQTNLIPKQELNKRWSFDSIQVRVLAVKLNDLIYCDSLLTIKDSIITIQEQQLVVDSLIVSKKDQQIELLKEQINYQYSREVKRSILGGLVISILLGLYISK